MKKKILPDGSIELEGDPEELAEYEDHGGARSERQDEDVGKGKRLLNEEEVRRLIDEALDRHRLLAPHVYPWTLGPYVPEPVQPYPWITWEIPVITYGSYTSDSVQIYDSNISEDV